MTLRVKLALTFLVVITVTGLATPAHGLVVEYDCLSDSYTDCCMDCVARYCIDGQFTGGYLCSVIISDDQPYRVNGCVAQSSNCYQSV